MNIDFKQNQVMEKCHYCLASYYNGECLYGKNGPRGECCLDALKRLERVKKGGAE